MNVLLAVEPVQKFTNSLPTGQVQSKSGAERENTQTQSSERYFK